MSYIKPEDFSKKAVDIGAAKIYMHSRDVFIRAFMAGAILALAAVFAVTIAIQTTYPLIGALLFPVGFCMLYLLGYDLLTGVFVLTPLAWIDRRPGVTLLRILKHWGQVFIGNFAGALTVALLMAVVYTYGFSTQPDKVGQSIAHIGENRTIGYKNYGIAGWITIFIRGVLCNWMVSLGVIGAMISTTVSGKFIAMWMPVMLFFSMGFEHSIVNMFLFPFAMMMGGQFSILDYLLWNEIPVVLGNLIGGLILTGLTLYTTHVKTAAQKNFIS
ncbi:formate/nitrite transporter family protein [Acinetobacter larvae]|uniref:Formate transporter n=1 Tax=Acinetobacter larvae TaxID=1789224 RepID=A0A1B2LVK4_9GAMM|nr:formate/nitrite transporter family protein [Acinetobacter larvae]AOA56958.1 formate transporter [Acinetobacter larvae]